MADPPTTLAAFLLALKEADIVCRPEGKDWAAHVELVSVAGRTAVVTEEEYYYWLEVLPPKYQRGSHFCFAEGAEPFRLFWIEQRPEHFFCRQLTWDETIMFC